MKKLATAITAIALIGTPAFAADIARKMPVKAPPPPPPAPVYNWTGWYVGGNVGYSWGDAHTDIGGSATTISIPFFEGGVPNNFAFAGSNTAALQGVIGGGQIGYNYQFSPQWVLGFETDIQASGERRSSAFADSFSGPLCAVPVTPPPPRCSSTINPGGIFTVNGTAATAYEAKIEWFGTVRGRLGYLVNDQVLLYATGGLAYGRVGLSGATNVNGVVINNVAVVSPFTAPGTSAFGASRTNVGWTAGAGIEGRFAYWLPTGWTWKLEYLYLDLGSVDTVSPFPPANPGLDGFGAQATPFAGTMTTHTHFTDNIVRVGLNYQFH
jgi:outer membrane immunogenic protein